MLFEIFYIGAVLALMIWLCMSPLYWKRRGVVSSLPWPLIGSCSSVFTDGLIFLFWKVYDAHPNLRYVGLHFFTRPLLFVRDPSLVQNILVRDSSHFLSRGFYLNAVRDPYFSDTFFTEGRQWRETRNKMTPHFTTSKVRGMLPYASSSLQSLTETISSGGEIEVRDLLLRYTIDVITTGQYGVKSDAFTQEDSKFMEFHRRLFSASFFLKVVIGMMSPSLYELLRLEFMERSMRKFFCKMTDEIITYRETGQGTKQDYIQALLELKKKETNPNGLPNTYEDGSFVPWYNNQTIAAQLRVIFAGATDTTSSTMSFCLYELAVNQEVQERTRKEIMTAMGDQQRTLSLEELQRLEYTNMVIAETLRKYPQFHTLTRECTSDYKVPDTDIVIDKGTLVFTSPMAVARDPRYFPEPERFLPERFSQAARADMKPGTYIPFGQGPRMCVGMRLAEAEMLLLLSKLLTNFRFLPCSRTKASLDLEPYQLLTAPKDGIWLDIRPLSVGGSPEADLNPS